MQLIGNHDTLRSSIQAYEDPLISKDSSTASHPHPPKDHRASASRSNPPMLPSAPLGGQQQHLHSIDNFVNLARLNGDCRLPGADSRPADLYPGAAASSSDRRPATDKAGMRFPLPTESMGLASGGIFDPYYAVGELRRCCYCGGDCG